MQQTSALCILCPTRDDRPPRAAAEGRACPVCALRLRSTILAIGRLWDEIAAAAAATAALADEDGSILRPLLDDDGDPVLDEHGRVVVMDQLVLDPVTAVLPAGPVPAGGSSPAGELLDLDTDAAVAVTETDRVPLVRTWVELVDVPLAGGRVQRGYPLLRSEVVRQPTRTRVQPVEVSLADGSRRTVRIPVRVPADAGHPGDPVLVPPGDQIGALPPRLLLESWVLDWRRLRGWRRRDAPAGHQVDDYVRWLAANLTWALEEHPALPDYSGEMTDLAGRLRRAAGETDPRPDYKLGVQCRNDRCDTISQIYQLPGEDWLECDACGMLYSPDEYDDWVRRLAAAQRARRPR